MSLAHIAAIVTFTLTMLLVISFFLTSGRRYYLLYLGFAFAALGVSIFIPGLLRVLPILMAVATFIMAILDGLRETRERLEAFRAQQRDRETAFAQLITNTYRRKR